MSYWNRQESWQQETKFSHFKGTVVSTYTNELGTTQSAPVRRLIAAGIKRGAGPLVVEQPQLSAADKAAHAAASYVRRPAITS